MPSKMCFSPKAEKNGAPNTAEVVCVRIVPPLRGSNQFSIHPALTHRADFIPPRQAEFSLNLAVLSQRKQEVRVLTQTLNPDSLKNKLWHG